MEVFNLKKRSSVVVKKEVDVVTAQDLPFDTDELIDGVADEKRLSFSRDVDVEEKNTTISEPEFVPEFKLSKDIDRMKVGTGKVTNDVLINNFKNVLAHAYNVDSGMLSSRLHPPVPNTACLFNNIDTTGFSLNGVLPNSVLYDIVENSVEDGNGLSECQVVRRKFKQIDITLVDELGQTSIIPVSLYDAEREDNHPEDYVYQSVCFKTVDQSNVSITSLLLDVKNESEISTLSIPATRSRHPLVYRTPTLTLSPISNAFGHLNLHGGRADLASNVLSFSSHVAEILDQSLSFNFFSSVNQKMLRSTMLSNYMSALGKRSGSDYLNIYGVRGTSSKDVINAPCECFMITNSCPPPEFSNPIAEFMPVVTDTVVIKDHEEYHCSDRASGETYLPCYLELRSYEPNYLIALRSEGLYFLVKGNKQYKYANFAATMDMVAKDDSESIVLDFYDATDDANLDTRFPSVRQLMVDAPYFGTVIVSVGSKHTAVVVTVHIQQANLILYIPTFDFKPRTIHFRLCKDFTNSFRCINTDDEFKCAISQVILHNIFRKDPEPKDLIHWPDVSARFSNVVSESFNTPLIKFNTTPSASPYGSNILSVLKGSTNTDEVNLAITHIETHLRECCGHAGNLLNNQFKSFPRLPVFSRCKYDDHFYDTPTLPLTSDKPEVIDTFKRWGLYPVSAISTHTAKALQSRTYARSINGPGAKHGFGYNSFDLEFVDTEGKKFIRKVYSCEFCNLLYPTMLGSLYCKAVHVASQTLLIIDKKTGKPRASYVHTLLPHIKANSLVEILIGPESLGRLYTPGPAKVYKIFMNTTNASKDHNSLTIMVLRHTYDSTTGLYVSSEKLDSRIDVSAFTATRPTSSVNHTIRITQRASRGKVREAPATRDSSKAPRARSSSRVVKTVDNSISSNAFVPRPRRRNTKRSASVKNTAVSIVDKNKIAMINYVNAYVPDQDHSNYKSPIAVCAIPDTIVVEYNSYVSSRAAELTKLYTPFSDNTAKGYGFYASLSPHIFRLLGKLSLECFAALDNFLMIPYCTDYDQDPNSLGDVFKIDFSEFKNTRLYANPPYIDETVTNFLNLIGNNPVPLSLVLVVPAWPDLPAKLSASNFSVGRVVFIPGGQYDGVPAFIHGDKTSPRPFRTDKAFNIYFLNNKARLRNCDQFTDVKLN